MVTQLNYFTVEALWMVVGALSISINPGVLAHCSGDLLNIIQGTERVHELSTGAQSLVSNLNCGQPDPKHINHRFSYYGFFSFIPVVFSHWSPLGLKYLQDTAFREA